MADYRCYCLDRHGCIRAVTAIAADTDEDARSCGALLLATCAHYSAEIWDGRRHVGAVERPDESGPAEPRPQSTPLRPHNRRRVAQHSTVAPSHLRPIDSLEPPAPARS